MMFHQNFWLEGHFALIKNFGQRLTMLANIVKYYTKKLDVFYKNVGTFCGILSTGKSGIINC